MKTGQVVSIQTYLESAYFKLFRQIATFKYFIFYLSRRTSCFHTIQTYFRKGVFQTL